MLIDFPMDGFQQLNNIGDIEDRKKEATMSGEGRGRKRGATPLLPPLLILVFIWAGLIRTAQGSPAEFEKRHDVKRLVGLYTGPYFDPVSTTNITAQLGTHAYLPCKVKQLGNKSVSWIRKRDAHILTVDRYTFIADERFQSFLVDNTDTWTLQVKYVQARDAGQYECQVSTEPKISQFVKLNVVVPKTEIVGDPEIYVKAGSTVSLRCVITRSLEEPAYIFWYRDSERVLNYDRSLIDIRMERIGSDTTVGTLVIYNTRKDDSGNYSCNPSNLDPASMLLHVLNGEHPAAMQRGKNSASPIPWRWWSHFPVGLGLASCFPIRKVVHIVATLAFLAQILPEL